MSSYFDEAAREVSEDFSRIAEVEARVERDCELVAGDVDTPEEWRKRIIGAIAIFGYARPDENPLYSPKGREVSDVTRRSALISELHSIFHYIASARIETRFGRLNDNPRHILSMRDAYVKDKFGE